MVRRPRQVALTAESREYVSDHRFWKRGITVMFNIKTVNFNVGSYLHMTPETEKDKKDLYLQSCLECRRSFTPIVYYADVIPGA